MRAGWYPGGSPSFPLVLGTDGAGRIAAMGSHVSRFKIGDPVYAYSFMNPKGGFHAQYVAAPAENVAPVPAGLSIKEAGAIGTTGLTAIQGIDGALELKRGESVIIHGASGGVGTMAIQFAKLRGARVLACASGNDGAALARQLGADSAIDGRREDVEAAARAFAPHGADAILALAGGDALDRFAAAIRSGGRLAYPNGVEPEPEKRPGIRIVSYDAVAGVREFEQLNLAIEAARLRVPIAAFFPLGDAAKAHERLAEGHVLGKIVLQIE